MTWLALLFGLLCAFGGLQSGAFAQEGVKISYPTALERIESLVVSLNESLQEELQEVKLCLNQTKKKLGEVQREKESLEAALLETRKELGATKALHQQEIDELRAAQDNGRVEALENGLRQVRITVSDLEDEELPRQMSELNEDLIEVRRGLRRLEDENLSRRLNELAIDHHKFVIKTITTEFRQNVTTYKLKEELQELKSRFAEIEVGEGDWESRIAMSRALTEVRRSVSQMESLLSNLSAAMERGLNAAKVNFTTVKSEVELVEKKLCDKVEVIALRVEDNQQHSAWSVADLNQTVHEMNFATSQQWKSINGLQRDWQLQNNTVTRLSGRVTQQDATTGRLEHMVEEQKNSVNRLSDSVLTQEYTTDNLSRTVAEQGVCIARLKRDVEQIKSGPRNLPCDNPTSCKELYQCDPTPPTGYYNITTPQGVRRVYCEMNTSNCGDERGGWMRVAHIDMTDPGHSCPQGLRYIAPSSKRMCTRTQYSLGCSSVTFPLHGVSYSKVCGRARGYQYGITSAFTAYYQLSQSLEGYYTAGLSVTHDSPRDHIWTFAAGLSNDRTPYAYHCPCGQVHFRAAPRFVGENYHCESGWDGVTAAEQWHLDDPLWDSQGCPVGSTCCNRGGPWFSTTLTEEVCDDIEVRWCYYEQRTPEYFGVDQLEIFVH